MIEDRRCHPGGTSGWANGRPPLSQGLASKGRLNWDQKIPLLDGNSLDRSSCMAPRTGTERSGCLGSAKAAGRRSR
jgi:hypothetical protein